MSMVKIHLIKVKDICPEDENNYTSQMFRK